MLRPTAVTALSAYKLWLRYSDGVEGEVDLPNLAGRGVFKRWDGFSENCWQIGNGQLTCNLWKG